MTITTRKRASRKFQNLANARMVSERTKTANALVRKTLFVPAMKIKKIRYIAIRRRNESYIRNFVFKLKGRKLHGR